MNTYTHIEQSRILLTAPFQHALQDLPTSSHRYVCLHAYQPTYTHAHEQNRILLAESVEHAREDLSASLHAHVCLCVHMNTYRHIRKKTGSFRWRTFLHAHTHTQMNTHTHAYEQNRILSAANFHKPWDAPPQDLLARIPAIAYNIPMARLCSHLGPLDAALLDLIRNTLVAA